MALATIIIQDLPEGTTDVRLIVEPRVTGEEIPSDFTTAQRMAGVALNAIQGALAEESPIIAVGNGGKLFVPN